MVNDRQAELKKKASTKKQIIYLYVFLISFFAIITLRFIIQRYIINDYMLLLAFSILAIIAETFLIPLPKVGAISVSFALTYSAIILTDPLTACIISATGVALRFPYKDGIGRIHLLNDPIYKTIFNVSQYIINSGLAGMTYVFLDTHINMSFEFFNPIAGTAALIVYILLSTLFMSELMTILLNEKFIYMEK